MSTLLFLSAESFGCKVHRERTSKQAADSTKNLFVSIRVSSSRMPCVKSSPTIIRRIACCRRNGRSILFFSSSIEVVFNP
jgi:hypothetical protein